MNTQTEQIRDAIEGRRARLKAGEHVEINSGELGRSLGMYPGPSRNRMPNVCRVMRTEMTGRDAIISDTRDDYEGPKLTIRYWAKHSG